MLSQTTTATTPLAPYIVRQEEFRRRLGVGKTTFNTMKAEGLLPPARMISKRAVGYLSTCVDEFLLGKFNDAASLPNAGVGS